MARQDHRVPIEDLNGAIEKLLKAGPHSLTELSRALGWSTRAVTPRLEQLELEDRAHRIRIQLSTSPSVCYHWHAGPAPGKALRTGRTGRDPLVAALFGPAGQASA